MFKHSSRVPALFYFFSLRQRKGDTFSPIRATTMANSHFKIATRFEPFFKGPEGRLLISMESRFSIYTVSTLTSVFVFCAVIASRLLPRTLSVTVETLSVSPFAASRTVMVVTSMTVSCTATITCSFTESVCS